MEGKRTYRWEHRRKKKDIKTNELSRRSLFSFQIILVVLVFFLWALGLRTLGTKAIITSPCVESTVRFGAFYEGPSVFERLRTITFIALIFWLCIGLAYWKDVKRTVPAMFHGFILCSLVLLQAAFFHMTASSYNPPDGYLNTQSMVVSILDDKTVYNPKIRPHTEFESWIDGKELRLRNAYAEPPYSQCVWLDKNLITDPYMKRDDSYAEMSLEDRQEWSSQFRVLPPWPETTFLDSSKALWNFLVGGTSHMDTLRTRQQYRPMTDTERLRFIQKHKCLTSTLQPDRIKTCSFHRYIDWNAVSITNLSDL